MLEERRFFGMNQDDEDRVLTQGQYRYALNIRAAAHNEDSVGTITNEKGNTLVSVTLPMGTNRVIGAVESKDSNTVYYFVFNSLGKHSIYEFVLETKTIELVLESPLLDFRDNFLINHANVVDSELLYWTDGANGPRKINIGKGLNRLKKYCYNIYFDGTDAGNQAYLTEIKDSRGHIVASWNFQSPGYAAKEDFMVAYVASLPVQAIPYVKLDACGDRVKACMLETRYTMEVRGTLFQHGNFAVEFLGGTFPGQSHPANLLAIYIKQPIQFNKGDIITLAGTPLINGVSYNGTHVVEVVVQAFPGLYMVITQTPVLPFLAVFTGAGSVSVATPSSNFPIAVAVGQNFYPDPFKIEFIDRAKWPPACQPSVTLIKDDTRVANLVERRVFQFRIRYIFDDDEKSAWGPISAIPIVPDDCSGTGIVNKYNCIEIDYSDPRLLDASSLSLIRRAEIAMREHNEGTWYSVVDIEQEDLGIGVNLYRFYNDKVYAAVPPQETNKNFDAIPIISGAQEYIAGRMFDGDVTEGYDQVCVDAKTSVDYLDGGAGGLYNITGRIYIRNAFPDNSNFARFQPIYYTGAGGSIVFGGVKPGPTIRLVSGMQTQYQQQIPLGGFVVYLAGTDHYAISQQKHNSAYLQNTQNVPPGVYDLSQGGWQTDLKTYIDSGEVYSDFIINNVRPGRYILRIASHLTTAQQLSSREYQKTSTYAFSVGGTQWYEYEVVVSNQDVAIPATSILDLSAAVNDSVLNPVSSLAAVGYVVDKDIQPPPTGAGIINNTRIHLAKIPIVASNGSSTVPYRWWAGSFSSGSLALWTSSSNSGQQTSHHYTDHNGFFFYVRAWKLAIVINRILTPSLTGMVSGNNNLLASAFAMNGAGYVAPQFTGTRVTYGIFRNENNNVTLYSRTIMQGLTAPSNTDVVVVMTGGGQATPSAPNGQFEFFAYADTRIPVQRIVRVIVSYNNQNCFASLDPTLIDRGKILISNAGFNTGVPYSLGTIRVFTISGSAFPAFKRGYIGQLGLVYYDRVNRSTTVNISESLELKTLFYTENDPATGLPVKRGAPVVSWEINHRAPNWATHYQWVRTKNQQLSGFTQFLAGEVTYETNTQTPQPSGSPLLFTDSSVRYVRINLQNINQFKEKYFDSTLGITYTKGDRVRFIQDSNKNYYTKYFDYEILFESNGYIYIYKDTALGPIGAGTLLELYHPRAATNEKIYFEFSECYGLIDTIQGKLHKGQLTDQTTSAPATGVFQTGDVYYRLRDMPYNAGTQLVPRTVFSPYPIEDPSVSDFYISDDESIGRINIYDADIGQIRRDRAIRFSNVFIRGTRVNGLSSYEALSEAVADKGEGPIYKLQVVGNVMLAMQRATVQSMYINEKIYVDAVNAQQTIAVSDKVIGDIRPLQGVYGTTNPESVVEYAGNCYFFDKAGGNVMRYNLNGLFPISGYKMSAYFKNKAKEMQGFGAKTTQALGGFDPFFWEYIITFRVAPSYFDTNEVPIDFTDETLSFSDRVNAWVSFHSYVPQQYEYVGMNLVSFHEGQLYLHNSNDTYNNFYGLQQKSMVKVVGNLEPGKVKIYMALSQESNDVWGCPVIEIPPAGTYPNGMLSRLLPTKFKSQEGVFYSELMNDLNTPNAVSQIEALVNGRNLRGHVLIVTMENSSTEFVKLNALNIKYIHSELSKR